MINFGITVVLIGLGTFALIFASELSSMTGLQEHMLGLAVGGLVMLLCIPPTVFIWRALQKLTDNLSSAIIKRDMTSINLLGKTDLHLHHIVRDSILIAMITLILIWSLPLISQLIILGSFSTPVPIILLIGLIALLWRVAFKIHKTLVDAFSKAFLGENEVLSDD